MNTPRVSIKKWCVADSSDVDGTVFVWDGNRIAISVCVVGWRESTVNPIKVWLVKLALSILVRFDTKINYTNDLFEGKR